MEARLRLVVAVRQVMLVMVARLYLAVPVLLADQALGVVAEQAQVVLKVITGVLAVVAVLEF